MTTIQKGLWVFIFSTFAFMGNSYGTEIGRVHSISMQTPRVVTRCFPKKLWGILQYIERQTGRKVIITSGYRPNSRKRGSLHRKCLAADIRVPGISIRKLRDIARRAPHIGGIGTYRRKPGMLHVDVGPRREWAH